jgi:glycosyltransferase involved in cell wall biosynthesis
VPNRDPEALANAVVEALDKPGESLEMAATGRKLVEKRFTADRMVEGTLEVYLKLFARARDYSL